MKTTMKWLCALLPLVAVNCGGEPIDATSPSEPAPASDPAELVKVTVARRNDEGTYTRTESYATRQQIDAAAAARLERNRKKNSAKAGDEIALTTAPLLPIGPGGCWEWDSSWLYSQPSLGGSLCCVVGGGGSSTVSNMCGFTYLRSVWTGDRAGWYHDNLENCYAVVPPQDIISNTGCFPTWYGQD